MFILIVSRGYPNPTSPLRGIFEFDQAKALSHAGHKVVYISLDLRSIWHKRKFGKTNFESEGVKIYNIAIPLGKIPAWLFIFFGKIALGLVYKDVIEAHGNPDLIHSHFYDISSITASLKTKNNIPLVITEHSSNLNTNEISNKTLHYGRIAFSSADKIICVSTTLSKKLRQHFNVESVVIPNIVDIDNFKINQKIHNDFVFISVGNLIFTKGFDILIMAFSQMKNQNCRLVIIGDGPEKNNLQNLIDFLNLTQQITLSGKKSRTEINEMMSVSDAFVLASRSETFGVVYIEAMAAGLPVIATKCGGPEDFINQDNGLLVSINNPEQLSFAMTEMFHNNKKYNRVEIAKKCRDHFSPEVIATRLSDFYNNTIQNSG